MTREVSNALFNTLNEESSAQALIDMTVDRVVEESSGCDPAFKEWCFKILREQARASAKNVFAYCESPIERAFFIGLEGALLVSDAMCFNIERAPELDIRKAQEQRRERTEQAFVPYLFYRNLPDDARPEHYDEFLRQWLDRGLDEEGIEVLSQNALFEYDLDHYSALWITLQPVFKDFYGPGNHIRVDAVAWVPSNPSVKLVIECDGCDYHKDRKTFTSDRQRDRRLSDMGYAVRRYSGSEIVADLGAAVNDAHTYLLRSHDFGPSYADEWKKSFAAKHAKSITPTPRAVESWRNWRATASAEGAHA